MSSNPYPWVITPFTTDADPPVTSQAVLLEGKTATTLQPFAVTVGFSGSVPDCASAVDAATWHLWSPTDASDIKLWLDAGAGVTQSSNAISAWADQSGAGLSANQSTASKKPTYVASGLNSLPIVTFDGDDVLLTGNQDWGTATACTMLSVHKNTSSAVEMVIDKGSQANSGSGPGVRLEVNASAANKTSVWIESTGGAFNRYETSDSNATPANQWHVISATVDVALSSAEGKIYDEGTLENMTSPTEHTGNIGGSSPYGVGCLSDGTASLEFTGSIAELIVYLRVLTTTERVNAETYLRNKYAL